MVYGVCGFTSFAKTYPHAIVCDVSSDLAVGCNFVAEWIHFTLFGIILPTITLNSATKVTTRLLGFSLS